MSKRKLENIRREVLNIMNRNGGKEVTDLISIEPEALNQHEAIPETEPLEEDKIKSKLYDNIFVTFNKYKERPMCERGGAINLTQESRETLEGFNKILTKFIEDREDITLIESNAPHYLDALVISSVNSINTKQDTPEFYLDQTTNLKIKKIRKSIGRLTAANKSGKMTKKVKTLLKTNQLKQC